MISAAIIAWNEEKYISRVLENVKPFVDEMIVVDSGSTDKTVEIAESLGAKVFYREFDFNYANQKNYALEQCKGDWILCPDCDEFFSLELLKDLSILIQNNELNAYMIWRHTIIDNIVVGEEHQPRLLRRGIWWADKVHEQIQIDTEKNLGYSDCPRCMYHLHTWNRQHYNNKLYSNIRDDIRIRPAQNIGEFSGKEVTIERDSDSSPYPEWRSDWRRIESLSNVHDIIKR